MDGAWVRSYYHKLLHKMFIRQEDTAKGTAVNYLIYYSNGIPVNWIRFKFVFSKSYNTSA